MRMSRSALVFPIITRSSAKNTADMVVSPRAIPLSDELSSIPRLFINKANRRGERLHPKRVC